MPYLLLKRLASTPLFVALSLSIATMIMVDGVIAIAQSVELTQQQPEQRDAELTPEEKQAEGDRLFNEAVQLWRTSQWQEALELLEQALVLYRDVGVREAFPQESRRGERQALNVLGAIADNVGQYSQALDYYQQLLVIRREINDRAGEGIILNNIGAVYQALNDCSEALKFYQSALVIAEEIGERASAGTILNNLGAVYRTSNNYPKALEFYQNALVIQQEIGDRAGESTTLKSIGTVYRALGNYPKALNFYQDALVIRQEIGDRASESILLNDIGFVHDILGNYPKALEFFQNALTIVQEIGDRESESGILSNVGAVYQNLGDYPEALEVYQNALLIAQEMDNQMGESTTLNNLGLVHADLGDYPKALESYQNALLTAQEIGAHAVEGAALNNLGEVYRALGDYPQSLAFYQDALVIAQKAGNRLHEGRTLNNIGLVYDSLGNYPKALDFYHDALAIIQELGDRASEGDALHNIGGAYKSLGDYLAALDFLQNALVIRQEIGDRAGEGGSLNNIGVVYDSLGNYPKALEFFQNALAIAQEIDDRASEGFALHNIGGVYNALGNYPRALEFYKNALLIAKEIGDRASEGIRLSSIGTIYQYSGNYPKALESYQNALLIAKEIGDRKSEGNALNNIGAVYRASGDYPKALDFSQNALVIQQEIGNRTGEGTSLNNIGGIYYRLGDYPQALDYYQQALGISREIGDRESEGNALNNIGWLLDQTDQPELAIAFLKQSVSTYEKIRQSNRQLSQDHQQSYTDTISDTYRKLADLLLQENRVLEAQRILDLLKVQELDEYLSDVRGNEATETGVDYWRPEQTILDLYQELLLAGEELKELQSHPYDNLTPADQARLNELNDKRGELLDSFDQFIEFPDVTTALDQLRLSTKGQNIELENFSALQDNLANLGNAVLFYPLILEDRLELILVTPNAPPIRRPVEVSAADLNQAIVAFRDALRSPRSNAHVPAQQLYEWLIKPLETDLATVDAEMIVYAPDGALRYVPLAALHDGTDWLAQRFGITHITAASLTDFDTLPQGNLQDLSILAAACADCSFDFDDIAGQSFRFSNLPFTAVEVENLANKVDQTDTLINQAFNPTDTINRLGSYNVIHLATHAAFVPGRPDESFIVFGNGDRATLRDIKRWDLGNADLVVLSACETGLGGQDLGNGSEILGFGYQIQQAKAKAAIASLWKVSDGGTQTLMDAFYTALNNGYGKAEALRRAQQALITGDETILVGERGITIELIDTRTGHSLAQSNGLDHPYYWAPFILIGNGL